MANEFKGRLVTPGVTPSSGVTASSQVPATSEGGVGDVHFHTTDFTFRKRDSAVVWGVQTGTLSKTPMAWNYGNGMPDSNTPGNVYDYYFDTSSGGIYQKSDPLSWNSISGVSGNSYETGYGSPGSAPMSNNIIYLNLQTGTFYQSSLYFQQEGQVYSNSGLYSASNGAPGGTPTNDGEVYFDLSNGDYYQSYDSNPGNFEYQWMLQGNVPSSSNTWNASYGMPGSPNTDQEVYFDLSNGQYYRGYAGWSEYLYFGMPFAGFVVDSVTPPNDAVGYTGDQYFNITTGDVYLKNNDSSWPGSPNNNIGAPGPSGSWFTGASININDPSLGQVNDKYFDVNTGNYYRATALGLWNTLVTIPNLANLTTDIQPDVSYTRSIGSTGFPLLSTFQQFMYLRNGALSTSISRPSNGSNYTMQLPIDMGTNGYVLTTNGVGSTSWQPSSAGANQQLSNLSSVSINTNLNFQAGITGQVSTTGSGSSSPALNMLTGAGLSGSGNLTINTGSTSQNSSTTGTVNIQTGNTSTSSSTTGTMNITTGSATSSSSNSGSLNLNTGTAYTNPGSINIQPGSSTNGNGANINILSGQSSVSSTGTIQIASPGRSSPTGQSGQIFLRTGDMTGTANSASGGITVASGSVSASTGNSGSLSFNTGSSASGATGTITVSTGTTSTASEQTGSLEFSTGANTGGPSGGINIHSGNSTGQSGNISIFTGTTSSTQGSSSVQIYTGDTSNSTPGMVQLRGGNRSTGTGAGGSLSLSGGNYTGSGLGSGGFIAITTGTSTGSQSTGYLNLLTASKSGSSSGSTGSIQISTGSHTSSADGSTGQIDVSTGNKNTGTTGNSGNINFTTGQALNTDVTAGSGNLTFYTGAAQGVAGGIFLGAGSSANAQGGSVLLSAGAGSTASNRGVIQLQNAKALLLQNMPLVFTETSVDASGSPTINDLSLDRRSLVSVSNSGTATVHRIIPEAGENYFLPGTIVHFAVHTSATLVLKNQSGTGSGRQIFTGTGSDLTITAPGGCTMVLTSSGFVVIGVQT